ncbi:MAG TPA: acylase [Polyangiaceae bacterium]|nr:acylase [Polyangiaceae bacterium]
MRVVRRSSLLLAPLVLGGCFADGHVQLGAGEGGTGSRYHATIRQTSYGIPHVLADDIGSAAFALGYVGARDYGCILLDQIVRVRSERAKYFGAGDKDANVDSDFAMLTLAMRSDAERGLAMQKPDMLKGIEGYAAGFDEYLSSEKLAADCDGKPWALPISPVDLFSYYYWLAQLASADPLMAFIGNAVPPIASQTAQPLSPASLPKFQEPNLGSNGWAIGAEKSEAGTGMLLANPHFPWEGNRKFYESQITIPGVMNVYGASLLGVPVVNIGFNEHVAWTHTVTTAHHFTLYRLTLTPGDPTSYTYDGAPRKMTGTEFSIEVKQPDGTLETVKRTLYRSHYGPVISLTPLGGWSEGTTYSFRNANEDNFQLGAEWLGMDQAKSLDDLDSVNTTEQGIPWVNTMAVDEHGNTLYVDASRTPNLSPDALSTYADALANDPITQAVNAQGATLLDGSDPKFEWVDEGTVVPGIVPYSKSPRQARKDFVFNANDSYWLTNPAAPLTGYSLLFGDEKTVRSPRTRMNAMMLTEKTATGASGDDGKFSFDELSQVEFNDRESLVEILLDQVLARCTGAGTVNDKAGTPVDVGAACTVLSAWDRRFHLDSVGAVLWREVIAGLTGNTRFSDAFDANDPVATPKVLAPKPATGDDPVLVAVANAVSLLKSVGLAPDVKLGDAQHTLKGTESIPIHGGLDEEGAFNVVTYGADTGTLLPVMPKKESVSPAGLDPDGYLVNFGSSFMMVMEFSPTGPHAKAVLSYSESSDPASPHYDDQTKLFSSSKYRDVLFTEEDIAKDPELETFEVSGDAAPTGDR